MTALDHAFDVYGVRLRLSVPAEWESRLADVLPPLSVPCDPADTTSSFEAKITSGGKVEVRNGDELLVSTTDLDIALGVLDSQMRAEISLHAPDHVFIHAGAVALGGRALLLPGPSFAGKSTLVAALVRAGAAYLSDEYAVLDADGLVHPYPRRLSIRREDSYRAQEVAVETLGGRAAEEALAVAVIAVAEYRPGATWKPTRHSPGRGALALLSNAVPARTRPDATLQAVRGAAEGAIVLEGERGEAAETAASLLAPLG